MVLAKNITADAHGPKLIRPNPTSFSRPQFKKIGCGGLAAVAELQPLTEISVFTFFTLPSHALDASPSYHLSPYLLYITWI